MVVPNDHDSVWLQSFFSCMKNEFRYLWCDDGRMRVLILYFLSSTILQWFFFFSKIWRQLHPFDFQSSQCFSGHNFSESIFCCSIPMGMQIYSLCLRKCRERDDVSNLAGSWWTVHPTGPPGVCDTSSSVFSGNHTQKKKKKKLGPVLVFLDSGEGVIAVKLKSLSPWPGYNVLLFGVVTEAECAGWVFHLYSTRHFIRVWFGPPWSVE